MLPLRTPESKIDPVPPSGIFLEFLCFASLITVSDVVLSILLKGAFHLI